MQSTRVLISMPDEFLKDVDKMANYEDRSRAELIRQALREYRPSAFLMEGKNKCKI